MLNIQQIQEYLIPILNKFKIFNNHWSKIIFLNYFKIDFYMFVRLKIITLISHFTFILFIFKEKWSFVFQIYSLEKELIW
jgi:hypothetical protein